jgi:succinate dehydrogenase hydrophobic anchor subunit
MKHTQMRGSRSDHFTSFLSIFVCPRACRPNWLIQRATALVIAFCVCILFVCGNASHIFAFSLTFFVFVHLYMGLQEILADYIHHEITRDLVTLLLRIVIFILIKYACVFLVVPTT